MPSIFDLLGFTILCACFLYLLRAWILDILFYKRNGWDFTKDSGRFIYPGAGPFNPPNTQPIGNRAKMFFGYPIMVVGFAAGIVVAYLFDIKGK